VQRAIVAGVALLFTLGAAMAIMNFHADVSMPIVHERLYFLLTGEKSSRPLWLQIPYSIGVGAGILLFFNIFKQFGSTRDPSPLELEMYLYTRSVDQFRLASKEQKDGSGGEERGGKTVRGAPGSG
jgi:stage V sporulation protein AA